MPPITRKPVIRLPTEDEDRRIVAAAEGDPDAQPLMDEQLQAMACMEEVRRKIAEALENGND